MFASGKTSAASTGGYQISRSLRFNSADSAYLNRTPASASNRKTWTWSGWVKRSALNSSGENALFIVGTSLAEGTYFNIAFSSDKFVCGSGAAEFRRTTAVYRDVSAWYHLVVAVDTTQATEANRVRMYVNGVEVTAFDTNVNPTQNTDLAINSTVTHNIGRNSFNSSNFFSGYMTEMNLIDGQALTPSSFGETNAQTGVWQPKAYSGSYGTNGFYLNFSDNSNTTAATLGKDYSGNGNNWTPNNFSVTAGAGNDSLVDSPTSYGTDTGVGGTVRGNYATLNPLLAITTSGVTNPTLANGNLSFVGNATTDTSGRSTIGMTSGTWYAEITISYVSAIQDGVGIAYTQSDSSRSFGVLYRTNGNKLIDNTASAYGSSYAAGDVIGIAVDATNNQVTFYKNGTSQGAISFTPTTAIYFSTYGTNASPAFAGDINFGQRPFAYTAPSGFKALCTQNLPTPTIGATSATLANKYFDATLYTGTGSTLAVTNAGGFQPDWVWLKNRSNTAYHSIWDAVRGRSAGGLASNDTGAEQASTAGNDFVSFNSNGFSVGPAQNWNVDTSGNTYVGWQWKANGSGSTNTAGTITSTVSANTTSGFSVVTWTGNNAASATIGHGLGTTPVMIIAKERNFAGNWFVYTATTGNTKYLSLNTTAAETTYTPMWNSTSPTSTVFTTAYLQATGINYVAYCFAEVAGYSKFGSYTGNGSADGPFIYCGFRPACIIFKVSDGAASWLIHDNKRNINNVVDKKLFPNLSDAEATADVADFLSNGFKLRGTNTQFNGNGYNYIFAAFAENPFKYSLAR